MKTYQASTAAALLATSAMMSMPASAQSTDELITSALAAAPRAVGATASVATIQADGSMKIIKKGPGNFTCFPDNPKTPGTDPVCFDPNGMLWLKALISKTPPPQGLVGFGYMLMGGSDASNSDPYAGQPAPGHSWVDTGPHVMIMNAPSMLKDYPSQAANPDTSVAYVMYPGTPYAHLMIPVH